MTSEIKVVEGLGLALVETRRRGLLPPPPPLGGAAAPGKGGKGEEGGGATTTVVRVGPLPRINGALTMRGHLLYLYGGVFEDGDREYCLDDAWYVVRVGWWGGGGSCCVCGGIFLNCVFHPHFITDQKVSLILTSRTRLWGISTCVRPHLSLTQNNVSKSQSPSVLIYYQPQKHTRLSLL